jgi:Flp pilus assembly protein TadB
MCTLTSLVLLFVLAAGLLAALSAVVHEGKFVERLQQSHSAQWQLLSAQKVWFHDGDPHYVSAQRYLWSGSYKLLHDLHLNRLALRTFLSMCCVALALLAWLLLKLIYPGVVILACVGL